MYIVHGGGISAPRLVRSSDKLFYCRVHSPSRYTVPKRENSSAVSVLDSLGNAHLPFLLGTARERWKRDGEERRKEREENIITQWPRFYAILKIHRILRDFSSKKLKMPFAGRHAYTGSNFIRDSVLRSLLEDKIPLEPCPPRNPPALELYLLYLPRIFARERARPPVPGCTVLPEENGGYHDISEWLCGRVARARDEGDNKTH